MSEHANHVCKRHYRTLYDLRQSQSCNVCDCKQSSAWALVCDVAQTPQHVDRAFNLEPNTTKFFSWICKQCTLCFSDNAQLEAELTEDTQSSDPLTAQKSKLLLDTIETLHKDGVVFTKDIVTQYKSVLKDLSVPDDNYRLCNLFVTYLIKLTTHHDQYRILSSASDASGRAIYDKNKFTTHSLQYTFRLKEALWKSINIEHLQHLIRQQITKFPTSKNFDYTQLVSNDGTLTCEKYFVPELYNILDACTKSRTATKEGSTTSHKHTRKTRIQMVIGILCLTMNPACCFVQTMTGLLCYAYGLRDKGFKALNALGACCSIDHVRSHGAFWAGKRTPVQNLDPTKPWRVTIDSLNFHIKFAKNLAT